MLALSAAYIGCGKRQVNFRQKWQTRFYPALPPYSYSFSAKRTFGNTFEPQIKTAITQSSAP